MPNDFTSAPGSAAVRDDGAPIEVVLTRDDANFVYHSDPDRFFTGGKRPLRLIESEPPLVTYHNAVYVPASRAPKQKLGSIYDENLNRIEDTVTRRGTEDRIANTDPLHLQLQTDGLREYDRPILYLGTVNGHFGHFVMESLSYWWPLVEELGGIDSYLIHIDNPRILDVRYVRASLDALGISDEQIIYFDEPVRLKEVIVPASAFQLHSHIYTKYKELMNRLAKGLGVDPSNQTDQPIFLSRTQDSAGVRRYVGEEKVESFLAQRGVRIAYPGKLPFAEQAKLVNEHKNILGFQGSQLVNVTLALQPRTIVQFSDNRAWGDHLLIDKCFGHSTTYVNVCEWDSVPRELYRYAVKRLTGKNMRADGFVRVHKVDYDKTIAWLEDSGYLS